MKALLIPVEGPLEEVELEEDSLAQLQKIVGGNFQMLPLPDFIGAHTSRAVVNEEGHFDPDLKPNRRATDFMVPGVGIQWGDYIAGNFLLIGAEGTDVPEKVEARARLIEREAG